jgi:DNA-binding MarR family transcriptional regulator
MLIHMDRQDIRTLRLLEEIENDNCQSQRQIALRLNISLGLANAFVKRLARKGYFKISTVPKNKLKYILTPKGSAEKARLSYEYIRLSFRYYKHIREKLNALFSTLEKKGIQEIAFFGTGELAEIAYLSLQSTAMRLVSVYDASDDRKNFFGKSITSPDFLYKVDFDLILVTNPEDSQDSMSILLQAGVPPEKIVFII